MEKPEITAKELIDDFAKWIPCDGPERIKLNAEDVKLEPEIIFVVKESWKQKNAD